jgi:hypothetical protein
MKRTIQSALILAAIGASIGIGFYLGAKHATNAGRDLVSGIAEQELANTLMALRYLERGEQIDAKKLLQAETNGQLSWIVQNTDLGKASESGRRACPVLNTLKQYREKHHLFTGADWNHLWGIPGMKDEEQRRIDFLSNLDCGTAVLFRLE